MAKPILTVQKLLYIPKPNRWMKGVGAELPESYKKFWKEWKLTQPSAVHYIPRKEKFERNEETGVVLPVQNVPLPLRYPKESNQGIWGGEAIVQGFVKKAYDRRRVPRFWVPRLKNSVVYSEILDKYMLMTITYRTLSLIHENYGFDYYILKTPACDLRSELALKLKRQMLIALADKSLYPNDPEKREEIYDKYKSYLSAYTREDLEWYGLTYNEAVLKHLHKKKEEEKPIPYKLMYRHRLIEQLKAEDALNLENKTEERKSKWISKLNLFSNQDKTQ